MKKIAVSALALSVFMLCSCTNKIYDPAPTHTVEPTLYPILSGKVICIDAGHGINNSTKMELISPTDTKKKRAYVSGTKGKNQTEEELNLRIATKLNEKLITLGAKTHMTRLTHETDMSNIDRAEFANNLKADICIKIHADGGQPDLEGISILIPPKTHKCYNESQSIGKAVLNSVINATGAKNLGLKERSDLTGFNWSKVPVILIETGFMTNEKEDAMLETDEYLDKITTGIAGGFLEYFKSK